MGTCNKQVLGIIFLFTIYILEFDGCLYDVKFVLVSNCVYVPVTLITAMLGPRCT